MKAAYLEFQVWANGEHVSITRPRTGSVYTGNSMDEAMAAIKKEIERVVKLKNEDPKQS